jgi:geranylgeranyl diphosphate synthase type I
MVAVEVLTTGRPAGEVLAWSRATVDPPLRAAIDSLPGAMRHVAGYHFGWWDEEGRSVQADPGKAIRPALVLACAEAVGESAGAAIEAIPAAVAVELVHNFSLIHDDVMDADITRRYRPTVWAAFGRDAAILAGDALLALALEVLADSARPTASALLSRTVQRLLDGQSADLAFELRADVTLDECLEMAKAKTGALIGCSCALGVLYGGGRSEQVAQLRGFGERIGLAFQFVDDVLGIWGDPAVTGKPARSDLRSRKKSLPVVAALTSGTDAGRELAAMYAGPSEVDVERAAAFVESAGGRNWCYRQLDALLAEAFGRLAAARTKAHAEAELIGLARLIAHRDQ